MIINTHEYEDKCQVPKVPACRLTLNDIFPKLLNCVFTVPVVFYQILKLRMNTHTHKQCEDFTWVQRIQGISIDFPPRSVALHLVNSGWNSSKSNDAGSSVEYPVRAP